MVSLSVRLFTESRAFESAWRTALLGAGLDAQQAAPATLADATAPESALVIDASWSGFDEDELLAAVGYARALGALPVVALAEPSAFSGIAILLEELTGGLLARESTDVARIAASLARRADARRARRFEYLTLAPRGGELLAVFGDGRASLLRRPLGAGDDGSDVLDITLAEDAESATVQLASGTRVVVRAPSATRTSPGTLLAPLEPALETVTLDGVALGARIRVLRVAAGLTQAELARRTGIHRPNIARVEAGRHTPSLETLSRLAAAIGIPTMRVLELAQGSEGASDALAADDASVPVANGAAQPLIGTK
jgi:DNA-binding XRE family transcriptional regulator